MGIGQGMPDVGLLLKFVRKVKRTAFASILTFVGERIDESDNWKINVNGRELIEVGGRVFSDVTPKMNAERHQKENTGNVGWIFRSWK